MSDKDLLAFPLPQGDANVCHSVAGMTLRDYFAAKAMQALIAKTPFQEFPQDYLPYQKTAIGAYDYADAMLEARKA